jgi:hypothetical protein
MSTIPRILMTRSSTPPLGGAEPASRTAGQVTAPDVLCTRAAIRRVAVEAKRGRVDGAHARLVESALRKLEPLSTALCGTTGLDDIMGKMLAEQGKQAEQRCELARHNILSKLDKLQQKNLEEQRQIEKRIEAEKSSGIWSKLVTFFKGVAAALSAASSIFTGPVGIAAACLCVASIIVSYAVSGEAGKWLSLGLGLAGALCGGASNLIGEAAKGAARLAASAARLFGAECEVAAATGTMAKGVSDKRSLEAQAAMSELKAAGKKLLAEAEEEREEMKLIIEAQDRGVKTVCKILANSSRAAVTALGKEHP